MLYSFVPAFLASSMGSTPMQSAVWATRKVITGYAGSCLRVRRSSDNTEQDIGFSGSALDTASLLTFTGAGNGFVHTWYDQAGVAMNLVQTTQANQPQIVAAGSVLTGIGGQPALDFDGTNDYLETAVALSSILTTTLGVMATVFNVDAINTNAAGAPYNNDALWADDASFIGTHLSSGTPAVEAYNWDGEEDHASVTIATGTNYVQIWRLIAPTISLLYNYLNTSTPVTIGSATNSSLAGKLRVGRQYSTAYYDGKIAELQAWQSALADADIAIVGAAIAAVYGVTWT